MFIYLCPNRELFANTLDLPVLILVLYRLITELSTEFVDNLKMLISFWTSPLSINSYDRENIKLQHGLVDYDAKNASNPPYVL